jgi:hypothetical protein
MLRINPDPHSGRGVCVPTRAVTARIPASSGRPPLTTRCLMPLPMMFAVLSLPVLGAWVGAARGEDVKVLQQWSGYYYSGVEARGATAIRTADEWKKAWQATEKRKLEVPEIDFDKHMVIAAFAGGKTTGGYEVAVSRVEAAADGLTVHVLERTPKPGSPRSQSLSSPYTFAVVQRTPGKVSFTITTKTRD